MASPEQKERAQFQTSRLDYIPPPTPPANLPPEVVAYMRDYNRFIADRLTAIQQLTGGQLRWQNLRSALISTGGAGQPAHMGVANSLVRMVHNLGKIPEFYVANIVGTAPGTVVVYHQVADETAWTETTIDIRDNSTNGAINLFVM